MTQCIFKRKLYDLQNQIVLIRDENACIFLAVIKSDIVEEGSKVLKSKAVRVVQVTDHYFLEEEHKNPRF